MFTPNKSLELTRKDELYSGKKNMAPAKVLVIVRRRKKESKVDKSQRKAKR